MATGPRSGVTVLEAHTCWMLLRSSEVGRLAVLVADHPDIFPINYVIDHGTIVFRTAEGTKLAAAVTCPNVAFEADGYEPEAGEAWSVVVKGRAEEIKNMYEVLDAMGFPLFRGTPDPSTGSSVSCPTTSAAAGSTLSTQHRGASPLIDAPPHAPLE